MSVGDAEATANGDQSSPREHLLRLQRLLLPASLPAIGCTQAAAGYRAHNHAFSLGGDWYDLVDRPDDKVVGIIGDVVGHGAEQISVMGQLRAASNAFARVCSSPAEILSMLEDFAADLPDAAMATAQVIMLDGSDRVTVASAGHPPPLVIDGDGAVTTVEGGRCPPLSMFGAGRNGTFHAGVGDLIVLYTDGVVDRIGPSIDTGIAELGRFVAARRSEPVAEIVSAALRHFSDAAEDDMAMLVLRPIHDRSDSYRLQRKQEVGIRIEA